MVAIITCEEMKEADAYDEDMMEPPPPLRADE